MLRYKDIKIVTLVFLALLGILIFSMVIATNIGAVDVESSTVFKIVVHKLSGGRYFDNSQWSYATESIIWNLRFPKVIITAITGAGLALAGVFMQVLTKNPLADPFILGISSGASSGATSAILLGSLPVIGQVSLQLGAFIGSIISILVVFVVAGKGWNYGTTRLVLVGMAVSSLFSAITNFIIFITPNAHKVANALFWMTGSFSGVSWSDVIPSAAVLIIGLLVTAPLNHHLDAMLLGEDLARTKGVDTKKVKLIIIIVSTLITSVLVSMTGIIGFVGLVIPHISRLLIGSTHKKMIPFCLVIGAIFMVLADMVARICIAPSEMPVGVITALIGVPFFLAMIRKSKYGFGG